ncbi:hypothetical protein RRG08_021553 [Elysia crispata]|uniref:Uncharacterized protein n=1 Tax=Elysia crispata TaxID=231223 RepID=A0AAE1CED1_9GAST|nr:hypothetical protein RRG08_021553 [Elysia crispata]
MVEPDREGWMHVPACIVTDPVAKFWLQVTWVMKGQPDKQSEAHSDLSNNLTLNIQPTVHSDLSNNLTLNIQPTVHSDLSNNLTLNILTNSSH